MRIVDVVVDIVVNVIVGVGVGGDAVVDVGIAAANLSLKTMSVRNRISLEFYYANARTKVEPKLL